MDRAPDAPDTPAIAIGRLRVSRIHRIDANLGRKAGFSNDSQRETAYDAVARWLTCVLNVLIILEIVNFSRQKKVFFSKSI